jgi:hypothetical protein
MLGQKSSSLGSVTRSGESDMSHMDGERETNFSNEGHVYEDVLLECSPVVPEDRLEEAV